MSGLWPQLLPRMRQRTRRPSAVRRMLERAFGAARRGNRRLAKARAGRDDRGRNSVGVADLLGGRRRLDRLPPPPREHRRHGNKVGRTPWSARVPLDPLFARQNQLHASPEKPTRGSAADQGARTTFSSSRAAKRHTKNRRQDRRRYPGTDVPCLNRANPARRP